MSETTSGRATATGHAIEVRALGKRYGDLAAVDDVTFSIARGEVFALLGPNGAGKSTLIKMLEGFRVPSSGTARVLGVDPARGNAEWRGRIGVVSQSTADIERFTCREIVSHFAGLYANPRDVDDVLESVGLTEKARTSVRKLSGGQQRRVDVALGIIGRPEVLFLDEPTTGFDPVARRQFWTLIERLRDEGTTILLTTHYLDEAEHLSDRVGVIARGSLIDIAPVDELGGPDARTPIVRWTGADGRRLEERTEAPTALVARLAADAGGGGSVAEVPGLVVHRPSLEDVYLELIRKADARAGDDGEADVVGVPGAVADAGDAVNAAAGRES
ncbi:MAG: ABC transporter ATP-binding protein [Pseudoclavibacter sp.]